MTAALAVLFVVGAIVALTRGAVWAYHEGMRQGDAPEDAHPIAVVVARSDGGYDVTVSVDNPTASPVVASVRGRWAHRCRPVSGMGRTTHRRCVDPLDGNLVTIAGFEAASVSWATNVPTGRHRLVLDVHVWQTGGRLRRHRSIVVAQAPVPG